jgi:hypothetical protein
MIEFLKEQSDLIAAPLVAADTEERKASARLSENTLTNPKSLSRCRAFLYLNNRMMHFF